MQSRQPDAGRAEPAPSGAASFPPGLVVGGKYTLERVLGIGGVGVVLAARHLELDEVVAIKFLHGEMQQRPDIVRRFGVEARAAVRIKSEYAARVYDVGVSPELGPYLVMEYLEGKDLSDVLAQHGPLPSKRAVELVMQACEALAVAHSNGIVHRDVKPENLFIARREDGAEVLKVLDFGISKAALAGDAGRESVAQTQALMGSPLYMSPEQIRSVASVDHRTDVWSLGVVLYEMLTGEVPFPGTTITGVCARVLETEAPPLGRAATPIPEGLELAVRRALEKDPARRFQNVAEFAISLLPFGPSWARISAERTTTIVRSSGQNVGVCIKVQSSAPPPPSLLAGVPRGDALREPPLPRLSSSGAPSPTLSSFAPPSAGPPSAPASFAPPSAGPPSTLSSFAPPGAGPSSALASFAPPGAGPSSALASFAPPSAEPPSAPFAPRPASPTMLDALTRETRRTRHLVTIASTGALALAALAVGLVLRSNRPVAPAPTRVEAPTIAAPTSAAPSAPPAAAEVTLSLGATPAEAKLYLDDAPLGANPYRKKAPRDGLAHSIRAEAKGYVTRTVTLTFDSDKEVTLGLDRAPAAAEPARVGASGATAAAWRALAAKRAAQAAAAAPAPSAPPPSAAPAAEAAPKPVQEVELPRAKKPVRAIDSGNLW